MNLVKSIVNYIIGFYKLSITKIIKHNDFKKIAANFSYLFLLNIANFIFPLLTIPYLIRVLGIGNYGLIAFSISIVSFFTMIVDFGFNVSATRDIAINKNDFQKVNKIFSTVIFIKLLLAFVSFLIYFFLIFFIEKFNGNLKFYLLAFLSVFGQVLLPIWYFQGVEKMKFISIFYFIAKLINTVLIFVFIIESKDYFLVPIFEFIGFATISVVSLVIVFTKFKVKLVLPTISDVKEMFREGFYLFISNISVILYTTSVTAILGFLTNNIIVGYYSVAEKIIMAIRGVSGPISQVLYPYLSRISIESKQKVLSINTTILKYGSGVFVALGLVIFLFSDRIIHFVTNKNEIESIKVLKIFCMLPFIFFTHTVLAMFTMLVFNRNKAYSMITLSGGIINVFVSALLIYFYQHIGAAISVLFIEVYIAFRYLYYTRKNDLKII